MVKKVQEILKQATKYLYPSSLAVTVASTPPKRTGGKTAKPIKGNGGWSDHRDRTLCVNMAQPLEDEAKVDEVLKGAANVRSKKSKKT